MDVWLWKVLPDIRNKSVEKWSLELEVSGVTVLFCLVQFRLRNSGVKNVIYLIEKFGSNQHLSIPEDSLNQAIVNTQVTS